MPVVDVDGIATRYEVTGSGPPILLFSPGGFHATLENWSTHGVYRRTGLVTALSRRFRCIAFDRREAGGSGGRVERITWGHYAAQGVGLLDHLGIERTHLLGGCVGASVATTFAVAHPARTASMVLYSPAGGARYRLTQHERFACHAGFAATEGLDAVADLARDGEPTFSTDPRVGPWASVLRFDDAFDDAFRRLDPATYQVVLEGLRRTMFDRDSVPGPEPEDLLALDVPALVVPGQDASHARSAAWFLHECLPGSELWDVDVAAQTARTAPRRVAEFLDAH